MSFARFAFGFVKWVVVPVGLGALGYYIVGPQVSKSKPGAAGLASDASQGKLGPVNKTAAIDDADIEINVSKKKEEAEKAPRKRRSTRPTRSTDSTDSAGREVSVDDAAQDENGIGAPTTPDTPPETKSKRKRKRTSSPKTTAPKLPAAEPRKAAESGTDEAGSGGTVEGAEGGNGGN